MVKWGKFFKFKVMRFTTLENLKPFSIFRFRTGKIDYMYFGLKDRYGSRGYDKYHVYRDINNREYELIARYNKRIVIFLGFA